jgi:hypothetical protein
VITGDDQANANCFTRRYRQGYAIEMG